MPGASCSGACASLPESGHRPGRSLEELRAPSESGRATERGARAERASATDDPKAEREEEAGGDFGPFSVPLGHCVMLSASVPRAIPAVLRWTLDTSCRRRYSAASGSPRRARRRRARAAARAAEAAGEGAEGGDADLSAAAAAAEEPRSLATAANRGCLSALRENSAWRRGTDEVGGRAASSEAAGHGGEEPAFPLPFSAAASRCAAASSGTRESTPHTSTMSLSFGLKLEEEAGEEKREGDG